MAIQYDVCELRPNRRIEFASEGLAMNIGFTTDYQVIASDPTNPNLAASDISPLQIITAPGLPQVNRSVYYFGGNIIPYVVCKNKTATQDQNAGLRWVVTTTWGTREAVNNEEEILAEQPPPNAITDLSPVVEVSYVETERVIYTDYNAAGPNKTIETPTGNLYAQPTIERIAIEQLRITQYEEYASFADLLNRMFKYNSDTYRSYPPTSWIITNIEPTEVTIQLAAGPAVVAQITYTLHHSNAKYPNGDVLGWTELRALIDTHYYDAGGKKVAFIDDQLSTETIGLVDIAGNKLAPGSDVEYEEYNSQPYTAFNAFMRA